MSSMYRAIRLNGIFDLTRKAPLIRKIEMSQMLVFILSLSLTLTLLQAKELPLLAELITKNGVTGVVVIKKVGEKDVYTSDDLKAREEYKPASTFKILHSLIAIDGGYVKENDVFKWSGNDQGYPAWNKNHNLETAFKVSCVWCYEELERRIGISNYSKYLEEANYGNKKVGKLDTAFWLYGDLKISAFNQINFLESIVKETLPYRKESYSFLKKIMVVDNHQLYKLYGKTGWVDDIGWFVGYLEKNKQVWIFATRLEGVNSQNGLLAKRKSITIEALKLLGILEND